MPLMEEGSVVRVPKAGGAETVIDAGLHDLSSVAVMGTHTYFTVRTGLYRIAKEGGKATPVASRPAADPARPMPDTFAGPMVFDGTRGYLQLGPSLVRFAP